LIIDYMLVPNDPRKLKSAGAEGRVQSRGRDAGFPAAPPGVCGTTATGLLPQVMTPKRTVAAWRTRSSALATPARHCVRCAFCPNRFPLANPLPKFRASDPRRSSASDRAGESTKSQIKI
jgi:hypothetical protein